MTLTVLNVAYSLGTVGDAVGGAEQVLSDIDRALVDARATSIVIACEGSRAHGVLCATPAPAAPFDDEVRRAAQRAHSQAIASVLERYPVDVVHLHGVDFHAYLPPHGVPTLATLHLPPSWYPTAALAPSRPETFVHCVSESQRRDCPSWATLLPTIPNGVTIPDRPPFHGQRRGVVALGRICPEKGFHIALAAARRAGVPMALAGRVFPYRDHIAYWERDVVPLLDDDRRFIGQVDAQHRTELLSHPQCVLVPSLVSETSSLVAMEALAAGTPVVAFGKGALPGIVEHGVTGFLVDSECEMADAIDATRDLDPDACRAAAVERFSVEVMTRRYLERYRELTHRMPAPPSQPARARPRALALAPRRTAPPLELTTLRTEEALHALAPEWSALADVAECTPFQRPEWLIPWWHHFGTDAASVLTMRRGGELVGILPLYVRPEPNGERVLALIGTGNTDYVDVIAHPAYGAMAAAALVDHVTATADEWDRCELGPLPEGSPILESSAPAGWRAIAEPMDVCPVLSLGDAHGLEGSVPGHYRARLRNATRRLARDHDFDIQTAGPDDARELLDALCTLHGLRWQGRGSTGVLDDQRTRAFHDDVVSAMAVRGLLRLYLMRVDGGLAAGFYGFADRRRLYNYIGGFDPLLARYSVGSLIILHALEAAASDGVGEVDFLCGAEAYKYRWGAVDHRVHAWRMIAPDAAAHAA